jgi:hypothetical protein
LKTQSVCLFIILLLCSILRSETLHSQTLPNSPQIQLLVSSSNKANKQAFEPRIEIRYQFAGREELAFGTQGSYSADAVRRETWTNLTPKCASFSENGIKRLAKECVEARFLISTKTIRRDRVYPGVLSLGRNGVLVHTSYLLIETDSGINVVAPSGYKALPATAVVAPLQAENAGYLLIGRSNALRSVDGVTLVASEGFNPSLTKVVTNAISTLWASTIKHYGNAKKASPIFVLHQETIDEGHSYHGDVTPGSMIRLSFFGTGWKDMSFQPKHFEEMHEFVAHEIVHVIQRGMERSPPWVSEGNAEFLSLFTLLQSGSTTIERVTQRVRSAFNRCSVIASAAPNWDKFERLISSGQGPYSCGLALHVLSASRQPEGTAVANWRRYFEQLDARPLVLPDDSAQAKPTTEWLTSVLQDGSTLLQTTALEKDEYGRQFLTATFRDLMKEACAGAIGFFMEEDNIKTDDLAQCGQLANQHISKINDVALTSQWASATALRIGCAQNKQARLTVAADAVLTISCQPMPTEDPKLMTVEDARKLISKIIRVDP